MTTEAPTTLHPYDAFAVAYRDWWGPLLAPHAVRLLDRLDGQVDPARPMVVVDIGTGTGTLLLAALERWPNATGIGVDASERMLELAAAAARERGTALRDRIRLLPGSAERLPLRDGSADVAVSSFVIQLVASRAAFLREAHRILRPEGLLAVVTWRAADEPFAPDDVFDALLDELDIPVPPGHGRDPRPWTSARVAAGELRRAGFRGVEARDVWLEHRYTPATYAGMLEHWIEDELFAALDPQRRAELRAHLVERLERLPEQAFVWRRPLIAAVGRRA